MNLIAYKKEFDYRHDWDLDEENILKSKWPTIKFKNIPQAWIIPIDKTLSTNNILDIKEIRQNYGHVIVLPHNNYIENKLENIIKKIDMDLNE
jgi:hypothetical protein